MSREVANNPPQQTCSQRTKKNYPAVPHPYYRDIKSNHLGVTCDLTPFFAGSEMRGNGDRELRREAIYRPNRVQRKCNIISTSKSMFLMFYK